MKAFNVFYWQTVIVENYNAGQLDKLLTLNALPSSRLHYAILENTFSYFKSRKSLQVICG